MIDPKQSGLRSTKRWSFILSLTFLTVAVVFIALFALWRRHAESVNCSNQMHAILFEATFAWPDDHNGALPSDFLSMSNELNTPKILICPSDHLHQPAANWNLITTNNCSYEIVSPGILKKDTKSVFIRCRIHGYVGYADDRLADASGRLIRPNRLW
jgi:hypothetical protein